MKNKKVNLRVYKIMIKIKTMIIKNKNIIKIKQNYKPMNSWIKMKKINNIIIKIKNDKIKEINIKTINRIIKKIKLKILNIKIIIIMFMKYILEN